MTIETWKNPDMMSKPELKQEVKAWRQAMQEGSTVVAEDRLEIASDMEKNMLHVVILGKVDGYIPHGTAHKLDDILNSNIPYNTKLSQIRELCNEHKQ